LDKKDSVESYIAGEILSDGSNTKLVKEILGRLTKEQVIDLFIGYLVDKKTKTDEIKIPVSAFDAKKLSSFEIIVRYLKDYKALKNSKISELLVRSPQSVWNTYKKSRKKFSGKIETKSSEYDIPVSVFQKKGYTILESIVVFLKDEHDLRFSDIAKLINRDQRTIWTVYNRKKR